MMKPLSKVKQVAKFLKDNPNQKFNTREIATQIIGLYPEVYDKRRSDYATEEKLITQVASEISTDTKGIMKQGIQTQDNPRPRLYWYAEVVGLNNDINQTGFETFQAKSYDNEAQNYSEYDLYPKLIEYLSSEFDLYCLRIDEKRSKNTRGVNGNQWLHPDVVAMQAIDKDWHNDIKLCIKNSASQNVRLWSFEVKKVIDNSNIRSSFFQALSNSSWANEGYLVATEIRNQAYDELRILSDLHGIGVIVLNSDNPVSSEILIPAKRKANIDWQSINRIVEENKDFEEFINLLSVYYQTGKIFEKSWNK